MGLKEKIDKENSGAKFRRADLHVHSFGDKYGSYDVKDDSMTPEKIVDTAIQKNIDVISITDHNEIRNSEIALKYAEDKELLVIPGIEVSTIQGHLLLYFPTYNDLHKFHGNLNISNEKESCYQGFIDCLDLASQNNGFGVAAHIDGEKGFEKEIQRYGPQKKEIISHENLLGLEIIRKDSKDLYTTRDEVGERVNFIKERNNKLNKPKNFELAKVMNSDAHNISKLGRNSEDDEKITRLKMDELTFDSFKIAFLDPMSRVRIEELIPEKIPHFYGAVTEGGFLGDQTIKLSKNLTCIIGGRGAGKSTLLQSIKEGSGNKSEESDIVDSEVWPDRIKLIFRDELGENQVFVRDKFEDTMNQTKPDSGITKVPIESYDQGKTADIIQHANKNPQVLLDFFDEFIEFDGLKKKEENIRKEILEKQSKINSLRQEVNQIPEIKKLKNEIERKLEIQEKKKVGMLVKYEKNLQQGREFRESIVEDLNTAISNIKKTLSDKTLLEQVQTQEIEELKVGEKEYENIIKAVDELSKVIDSASEKIDQESQSLIEKIQENLNKWRKDESKILDKIDEKKNQLEKDGIKVDMAFIRQLAIDDAKYGKKLKQLEVKRETYKKEVADYEKLYERRKSIKREIYKERYRWAEHLNNLLSETVVDYFIKIKFNEGNYSEYLIEFLMDELPWYKTKTPKIRLLTMKIHPFSLLEIIKNGNRQKLLDLENEENERLLDGEEVDQIFEILNEPEVRQRIHSIKFEDFPELIVTKKETVGDEDKYRTKDFTKLSLGQQQSILLSILLYSDNKYPLLIDQPEDNLDSEFIYKTIVSNLKRVKEHRQVIIVTHNPNIAVLGDAELIIPLKSTSDQAHVIDRGSIDNDKTKDVTCVILEGSKEAFKRRKEIYNL